MLFFKKIIYALTIYSLNMALVFIKFLFFAWECKIIINFYASPLPMTEEEQEFVHKNLAMLFIFNC